jgi:hypothetical protein
MVPGTLRVPATGFCSALVAVLLFVLTASQPALADTTNQVQVGAEGVDQGLWVRQDSGPFGSYGGLLMAAPAIASVPNAAGGPGVPLYIGTGTDHALWVRSQTRGWQHLSSAAIYCIDNPAAEVETIGFQGASTLTVACQGSDHTLWYASEPVSAGSLPPPLTGWQSLGGVLRDGPAVATVDPLHPPATSQPSITFFVNGSDNHVWTRTVHTGWSQRPWLCKGHPAAGSSLTPGGADAVTVFACHGLDDSVWLSRSYSHGGGWEPSLSLGGIAVDGVGVASGPLTATIYIQGSDSHPWQRTYGQTVSGWSSPGGTIRHGTGAAALLSALDNP